MLSVEPNLAYDRYNAMLADMRKKVPMIRAFVALCKGIICKTMWLYLTSVTIVALIIKVDVPSVTRK